MALIDEVRPFADARALLEHLKAQGHAVVLASSAKPDEVEHYLDLLDARDLADDWTHSGDVERTKPEPDLVAAAVEKAGGGDGGDGRRLDLGLRGRQARRRSRRSRVLTGGFSEAELLDAGAACVFASLSELLRASRRHAVVLKRTGDR